jgi:hypothetical protein
MERNKEKPKGENNEKEMILRKKHDPSHSKMQIDTGGC